MAGVTASSSFGAFLMIVPVSELEHWLHMQLASGNLQGFLDNIQGSLTAISKYPT